MARKPAQTGDKVSSIAGKVLGGKKPTQAEAEAMAASLLRQDQKKGPRGK
jgi:hypothetical protein